MASPVIHHTVTTGAAADPLALVDGPAWDAAHTVTGLENLVNVDNTNASNLTSGTVPGAQMPALTGDVTTTGGAVATTLATVNTNVGTFGSATQSPQITANGKGLLTAAANVTITPAIGSITGLGTGVGTALAVNVGTAGSIVVNGGALGTPSSGTATNLSGTASALTAGTVTTNANLTGDVTSVGNATTIGSNRVTRAMEAQGVARSVVGVTGNATANVADIQGTANQFLGVNSGGTALAFQTMSGDVTLAGAAATIAANAVSNAKMATMAAWTFKANNTSGSATPTDITIDGLTAKASPAAADEVIIWDVVGTALKKATVSSLAASAGVSSIAGNTGAFTLNGTSGITNSVNDIVLSQATSAQFGAVKVDNITILATAGVIGQKATSVSNSLGADVLLNNTGTYFDGPSCAQGTSGTWLAIGTVTVIDTAAAAHINCKLWDGTTVISSGSDFVPNGESYTITLSGVLASPAGNIRISCNDSSATTGKILFNQSGLSKDSTLTVVRIQ